MENIKLKTISNGYLLAVPLEDDIDITNENSP